MVVGKEYKLQYTGQYCHLIDSKKGIMPYGSNIEELILASKWIFIGTIPTSSGENRNIFYSCNTTTKYLMFDVHNLDYVLNDHQYELVSKITKLEKELQELKKQLEKNNDTRRKN